MLGAINPKFATRLTPIWLLGVGVAIGLIVVLIGWAITCLATQKAKGGSLPRRYWDGLRDGPIFPIFCVAAFLSIFSLVAYRSVPNPGEILASLQRIPATGTPTVNIPIKAATRDANGEIEFQVIEVDWLKSELHSLEFKSDVSLTISGTKQHSLIKDLKFEVNRDENLTWSRYQRLRHPFPENHITELYVLNYDDQGKAGTLTLTSTTKPLYPQVAMIPIAAISVIGLFLFYGLQQVLMPRVSAIARATAKSEMSELVFPILLGVGVFLLLLGFVMPYNTFGEDIKMMQFSGLTLIKGVAIAIAVWAASTAISSEIDGRTALTLLSKPISRRSFVLGKFFGINWMVAVTFVILGTLFLFTVTFKVVYDARESAMQVPIWQVSYDQMAAMIPGLALAFMEAVVVASIAVAISTRLPMMANFVISFAILALGNLAPLIVKSTVIKEQFEAVVFAGKWIATVFPVLNHFNIAAAISGGKHVPFEYLAYAALYCLLYSSMAMLMALIMFEDRDLA